MRGRADLDERRDRHRLQDGFAHPARLVHLTVGETQHPKPLRRQPGVAPSVFLRLVKGSVGFDDQPMTQADKIDDLRADRHLSAELQTGQPSTAEHRPELPLGRGGCPPKVARGCDARQADLRPVDPSSVGHPPDTFSRMGRRVGT
jgi:hypothetical protein